MSQTWPLSRMKSQSDGETGVDAGNDNDKPVCSSETKRNLRIDLPPPTLPGVRRVRESPGRVEGT